MIKMEEIQRKVIAVGAKAVEVHLKLNELVKYGLQELDLLQEAQSALAEANEAVDPDDYETIEEIKKMNLTLGEFAKKGKLLSDALAGALDDGVPRAQIITFPAQPRRR